MKLESDGILIDLRPFGERDALARIFTRDYGVLCGMMRGAAVARKNRPMVGQGGAVTWNARLDSQLGAFHWESARNLAAPLMASPVRLGAMNAAFGLIAALLPEREKYDVLFHDTMRLVAQLTDMGTSADESYLAWEIELLRELGYALDLSHCASCGTRQDLMYLSPRTGRAVCASCGMPYAARLYRLPLTMDVTGRFLTAACNNQGISLPLARQMLRF